MRYTIRLIKYQTNYKCPRIYSLTSKKHKNVLTNYKSKQNVKKNYKSKHENACLKRCVLRSVLKQLRSFTALILDGNLFQSLGADAIKDLSPKVLIIMAA